jgi:uncharacterized SAM-binding protein YcdF (DUF218 family)
MYQVWTFENHNLIKADCAIVLGAAVYNSMPSPVFKERIKHAIDLYQQGIVSKIIFTGGVGDKANFAESDVAANFSIRAGVLKQDILTESVSHTTQENLHQAKILMQKHVLNSAIIVSDPLHLKRASIMAEDLGISAHYSSTPTTRYRSFSTKFKFLIREVYFVNHYFVTGH